MPVTEGDDDFPFKETEAAQVLRAGLERAAKVRGLSTRAVARELGYKATVVISHMATGRAPIPMDRADEIARVVGLDPRKFFLAVLEQRHPGSLKVLGVDVSRAADGDEFAEHLRLLAGGKLSSLPTEHKTIIREVVCERAPRRRWLSVHELPAMLLLRRLRPSIASTGLEPADEVALEKALDAAPR